MKISVLYTTNSLSKEDELKGFRVCKSRGTVLFLSSGKTEMTDTIEIGLKIFPKPLPNKIYIIL